MSYFYLRVEKSQCASNTHVAELAVGDGITSNLHKQWSSKSQACRYIYFTSVTEQISGPSL